jgi:hypothetical protein
LPPRSTEQPSTPSSHGAPRAVQPHLTAIARAPRAAGSTEEAEARSYAADVLRAAGFDVTLEPFDYSALPGRYGTPVGGAIALVTVLAATWLATMYAAPRAAALAFALGLTILVVWAWRMLGAAVLDLPWLRASSTNLVATRAGTSPNVWLVAHLDSKSQPVPSALRVVGIVLLATGIALTVVALLVTLVGVPVRMLWWAGAALASAGGLPVVASLVGNDSPGAVDNASGVAAVLGAAEVLTKSAAVGILLPSAEELGLAGARAWARARGSGRGIALNCDGVDDHGALTIMYSGMPPMDVIRSIRDAAEGQARVRRMPVGLLLDSVAFTDAGWRSVTLSHGALATLGRVHTRGDSLAALRGDAIPEAARVLARAAEALAR